MPENPIPIELELDPTGGKGHQNLSSNQTEEAT